MIATREHLLPIWVEESAFEGVKRIAAKSAEDMNRILGAKPELVNTKPATKGCIAYATVGKSSLLDELQLEKVKNEIAGKREVYGIFYLENPLPEMEEMLLVVGSDKRGTIYGIFALSEWMGISPLHFWGDVEPERKQELVLDARIETISKEPSVRYRGFFINDEWPCFGNWTMEHFGGFTAEMYDKVFELLLRLKGNCLWPAMWTSSFALDGPGSLNEELADCYGVIMDYSHHEPCLRASEEWDIYKGVDTEYGYEWNYATNKEGLLRYWRDGLKRSGKYENMVTMGMRGERDSQMLGSNSLADSIAMWKDIIVQQDRLIKEYADTEEYTHPRVLAIYKEVEDYFYGDANTAGLEGWEALDPILLMFCEDNFGNMRRMPQGALQNHPGGLGMYFHLDYHGGPISYEWINSTPLSKIWEQMTTAYEYGIRQMWMVNVGDLKGNEFPLSYFMNLAYDYETWGIDNLHSAAEYTLQWVRKQFGEETEGVDAGRIAALITDGIHLLHCRRPEALQPSTYKLAYEEQERVIAEAKRILEELTICENMLSEHKKSAYYSMVEYPMKSGMNHVLMHVYSARNEHYAKQGKVVANTYRELVTQTMQKAKAYKQEFRLFQQGKWSGMELGAHTGFVKWNEDGARMPLRYEVEPLEHSHLLVSRTDDNFVAVKNYGNCDRIVIDDFLYPGIHEVRIEVANDGCEPLSCKAYKLEEEKATANVGKEYQHTVLEQWTTCTCEAAELTLDWKEREITEQEYLTLRWNGDVKVCASYQVQEIAITDSDTTVILEVRIPNMDYVIENKGKGRLFLPSKDGVIIEAEHCSYNESTQTFEWKVLEEFGKYNSGMKMFPIHRAATRQEAPTLGYRFLYTEDALAMLSICIAPSSPLDASKQLQFGVRINGCDLGYRSAIGTGYQAGNPVSAEWAKGVLDQERRIEIKLPVSKGENTLEIYGCDAGLVLERIMITSKDAKEAYLGPVESVQI